MRVVRIYIVTNQGMPFANLIDLIVLAVATEGPATLSGMSKAEKAVNSVTWIPTLDVIEAAVDRSLASGYLLPVDCERFNAWLRLRNSGR